MSLKSKVIAINKILSDIYQQEMRLSSLLLQLDFDNEAVKLIGDQLLSDAVAIFVKALEETITTFQDGTRQLVLKK